MTVNANHKYFGRAGTLPALLNALDHAETEGPYTTVALTGRWDVGAGLSMAGRTACLQGAGPSWRGSAWVGTTRQPDAPGGTWLWASEQDGPVIDFTEWVYPESPEGHAMTVRATPIEGIGLQGDNRPDPTRNNAGIRLARLHTSTIRNLAIMHTGGPCWEEVEVRNNGLYMCKVDDIMLNTPVGAGENDVPWMVVRAANGAQYNNIGFRAITPSGNVGKSGALIVDAGPQNATYDLDFDGWFEYLKVPANGTLASIASNRSRYNFGWHDMDGEPGGNNSFIRVNPTSLSSTGGNTINGVIPGARRESGSAPNWPTMGVDMHQSYNAVNGVKGYGGHNVTIRPDVRSTNVMFVGSEGDSPRIGWVNDSGNTMNTLMDLPHGTIHINGRAGHPADVLINGTSP